MPASAVEPYLPIKALPEAIAAAHGLDLSTDNLRAIQQDSARMKDGLFLAGCARVSEIMTWLRKHPEFSRPRKPKYGQALKAA